MSLSVLLASSIPRSIFKSRNVVSCHSETPSSTSSSSSSFPSSPASVNSPDSIIHDEEKIENGGIIIPSLSNHSTTSATLVNPVHEEQMGTKHDYNSKEDEKETLKTINTCIVSSKEDNHLNISTSSSRSHHSNLSHNLTSALGCGGEISDILPRSSFTIHNHNQHHNSTNTAAVPTTTDISDKANRDFNKKEQQDDNTYQVKNNNNDTILFNASSNTTTTAIDNISSSDTSTTLIANTTVILHPDHPDFIPQRFIDGCEGNMKEAKRRWEETKKWRQEQHVEEILTESQPHYFTIKAFYPNYHCGHSKDGRLVYYERPGEINIPEMKKRGVTVDDMFRHWLFQTEYQFRVLLYNDETAKTISIFDVENINTSFLTGDPYHYFKKTVTAANHHYVERSYCIFIINAPFIMNIIWKACKQFIHPNSQKKVRILSKKDTLSGLQEFIDLEQIPDYYGGLLTCSLPDHVPPTVLPTSSNPLYTSSSSILGATTTASTTTASTSATTNTTTNTTTASTLATTNTSTAITSTIATAATGDHTTTNSSNHTNHNDKQVKAVAADVNKSNEEAVLIASEFIRMQAMVDKDNCRFYSPQTLQLNQYVHELNKVNGMEDPLDPWRVEEAMKEKLSIISGATVIIGESSATTVDIISSAMKTAEIETETAGDDKNISLLHHHRQQHQQEDEQKQEP